MNIEIGTVLTKTNKVLSQLLDVLDEKSRAILWYLWRNRHAEISELRELINATGDFEILYRLKEVINEQSQRLWGRSVVSFEQSRMDSRIGEMVLFSWWFLDEENIPSSTGNKPLVDVFNDKDNLSIIAQVPTSVDPTQREISYKNGVLEVRFKKRKSNGTVKEKRAK
jgi:HSP20 family molecular chaperone IbpA